MLRTTIPLFDLRILIQANAGNEESKAKDSRGIVAFNLEVKVMCFKHVPLH